MTILCYNITNMMQSGRLLSILIIFVALYGLGLRKSYAYKTNYE